MSTRPGIDAPLTAQGLVRTAGAAFPKLNKWLNSLPDPRVQEMCRYAAAHLWWTVLAMFLSRKGSHNGFDEQRQSGEAAENLGVLCGQTAEDPRFAGQPIVTCSDNAAYHASRVDLDVTAHRVDPNLDFGRPGVGDEAPVRHFQRQRMHIAREPYFRRALGQHPRRCVVR